MSRFTKILIISKKSSKYAAEMGEDVRTWLRHRGVDAVVRENTPDGCCSHPDMKKPDLIVILGGDGTTFSVVRAMGGRVIPVVGVNLGQVGFLTEIAPDEWQKGLDLVLNGDCRISERVILGYRILRNGREIDSGRAVNDIVVCRGGLARLLHLTICYGEEKIGTLRADGIIVSTATGATAYTVSAGGPLIHPELDVCTLTPICPFLSGFMPMVLPFREEVRVTISPGPVEPYLTVDGQVGKKLKPNDEIRIASRQKGFHLLHLPTSSYFKKLKSKGFILEE